jgi:tripartite-type tricarboxylate transporter receptor subunit TctC
MKKFLKAAAACLLATGLACGVAQAQESAYPRQPIRLVVPFTAGSGTDTIARAVGERLTKQLGQPVIVDNKPGAGGTIGAAQVAAAQPDGYTLLVHSAGHVANAALYPGLRYDTIKDFHPVAMLATLPNVLVVSPAKGYKSLADLVERAKAEPGKLTYASAGNGSATHINAEKFRLSAAIKALHVPYKGTPEALTDVMAGQIDWFFAPLSSALPLIKDGRLVALAVGSPQRAAALPNVPTTLEAGFSGSDYVFWVGLFAPARTPGAVVQQLARETERALQQPEVRERFQTLGAATPTVTQANFAQFVEAESTATTTLIRSTGIHIN